MYCKASTSLHHATRSGKGVWLYTVSHVQLEHLLTFAENCNSSGQFTDTVKRFTSEGGPQDGVAMMSKQEDKAKA